MTLLHCCAVSCTVGYVLQVATDTRLWLFSQLVDIRASLQELITVATNRAEAEADVLMPGMWRLEPTTTWLVLNSEGLPLRAAQMARLPFAFLNMSLDAHTRKKSIFAPHSVWCHVNLCFLCVGVQVSLTCSRRRQSVGATG